MKQLVVILALVLGVSGFGEHIYPGPIDSALRAIDQGVTVLEQQAYQGGIPDPRLVIRNLNENIHRMQRLVSLLEGGGFPGKGRWFPVDAAECRDYCSNIGMRTAVSPEGAQCVSGENRAASALGVIPFKYGCWKDCTPHYESHALSIGRFCYVPGAKQDNDRTDLTVGCFCRR